MGSGPGTSELDNTIGQLKDLFTEATSQAKQSLNYDSKLAQIAGNPNFEERVAQTAVLKAQLEAKIQGLVGDRLKTVAGEIEGVLTRTAARSAVLARLAKATNAGERTILSNLLNPAGKWTELAESFWKNLPSMGQFSEYAAEWGMVGFTLYQVISGTPAEGMSAAAYDAIFRLGGWRAGIAGLATDLFLQMARDGMWGMAGRSQDALLLLNGFYTAWGAQNVRESEYNMDAKDLWKTFPDNTTGIHDLEVRVNYHANRAAQGKVGTDADRAELEKRIVEHCMPIIKAAWRKQRDDKLKSVNELFGQAMSRVAQGGATLVIEGVKDATSPVILARQGPAGMEPVEVTLAVGFTYLLPDVFAKLHQVQEIVNALECNPSGSAFFYSMRVSIEVFGAGPVGKIGSWSNGSSQNTPGPIPDKFLSRARVTKAGWYTARLAEDAEFSVVTLAANSRDITDPSLCILPSGRFAIPLLGEADFEVRAEGVPPAVVSTPTKPPVEPEKKVADRPVVEAKEPQKKKQEVSKPSEGSKAEAKPEPGVPAGPIEMQGTFSDSFATGSGGGPIALTFSEGITRMKGSCDYKSSENVTGGNSPGRYEFAGGKYPRLFIADGRFTGSIAWIKHYVLFPSAVLNNSFDVEGTIDFQAGTITGHATNEPYYHWTVKFPPIVKGSTQTADQTKTQPAITPEQKPRLSETQPFGRNLVTNGGGEADKASPDGRDVVQISGWKVNGKVTLARYDSPNPDYAGIRPGSPVPPNGGANFFTGGPDNLTSSATQTVDLASTSDAVDSGKAKFRLAGYLGGYAIDNDNAFVTAVFSNGQGAVIGEAKIGPVLSKDRGGKDGLLLRETTGDLPPGTRSVVLTLTMTRVAGRYNDGYADEISFALSKP